MGGKSVRKPEGRKKEGRHLGIDAHNRKKETDKVIRVSHLFLTLFLLFLV